MRPRQIFKTGGQNGVQLDQDISSADASSTSHRLLNYELSNASDETFATSMRRDGIISGEGSSFSELNPKPADHPLSRDVQEEPEETAAESPEGQPDEFEHPNAEPDPKEAAAIKIQAIHRGYAVRKEKGNANGAAVGDDAETEAAAIKIQAMLRGYAARKQVSAESKQGGSLSNTSSAMESQANRTVDTVDRSSFRGESSAIRIQGGQHEELFMEDFDEQAMREEWARETLVVFYTTFVTRRAQRLEPPQRVLSEEQAEQTIDKALKEPEFDGSATKLLLKISAVPHH